MSENSAIEWCDDTFNPWWGCARVSPACVNCYADTTAQRYGHAQLWRRHGERRTFGENHWQQPFKFQRKAEAEGRPRFVFCASMADVFEDHPALPSEREKLWRVIEETPMLIWLLLTKRPENATVMTPWGRWPDNVWLGTSVETQRWADVRLPDILAVNAAVRFLSCEPLLGPVDLEAVGLEGPAIVTGNVLEAQPDRPGVDWVIAGGESLSTKRPTDPDWFRSLRDQCQDGNVPFFLKQLGGHPDKRGGEKAVLDGRRWTERPAPTPAL